MKVDPKEFKFCCLGVKANIEDKFTAVNPCEYERMDKASIHGATAALLEDDKTTDISQRFFMYMNDSMAVDFNRMALLLEYMRNNAEECIAAAQWIDEMDYDEFRNWQWALASGEYQQGIGRLAYRPYAQRQESVEEAP